MLVCGWVAAGEEPANAGRDHRRDIADALGREAPAQGEQRAEKRDGGAGEGTHDLDEERGAERASPQRQLQGGFPDPVAARSSRFSGRAGENGSLDRSPARAADGRDGLMG